MENPIIIRQQRLLKKEIYNSNNSYRIFKSISRYRSVFRTLSNIQDGALCENNK